MTIFLLSSLKRPLLLLPTSFVCLSNFPSKMEFFQMLVKYQKLSPFTKKIAKAIPATTDQFLSLLVFQKSLGACYISDSFVFFDKHKILIPEQYGFRKNISTSHALLDNVTTTYDNIHKKHCSGAIFLDLKKAFDTVCLKGRYYLSSTVTEYVVLR